MHIEAADVGPQRRMLRVLIIVAVFVKPIEFGVVATTELMAEDVVLRLLRFSIHDGTFLTLPLGGGDAGTLLLLMLYMRDRMLWVVWFAAHNMLFLLFFFIFFRQQIVTCLGRRNNAMA